ncbi:hypothetical protein [Brevundimonas sp.]|uniref:hypothetical protein n=1 Tax=Brevundimonas sp. TaxID=1871086 RepID=UPI0025BA54C3|nr:hypothetical protein [Brevundimonas sp.]
MEKTDAKPDPLDHDNNGAKGGSAPVPAVQHLVVIKSDAKRGLAHGDVIGVDDGEAKALLKANAARVATSEEVELAQPFVSIRTA